MLRQLAARRRGRPDFPDVRLERVPRSLWEFDEAVTAPLCGFAGAGDYYRRTMPRDRLSRIRIPTFILAADDDPLVPSESFAAHRSWPAVSFHLAQGGGHLGFIAGRSADPDRRWLDWRVIDWITS